MTPTKQTGSWSGRSIRRWVLCALAGGTAVWAPAAAQADEPPPRFEESQHFTVDPVVDGVLIATGFGFSGLLSLVLGTGEIQPVAPAIGQSRLLSIDRIAVTQTIDPNAGLYSDIGLWTAFGYAVLDPILSGARAGRNTFLVDATMYLEAISLTGALTSMTKIAVRRPRPIDYANCTDPPAPERPVCPEVSDTNNVLSFFSGHASATGTIAATATYLAFVRSGARSPRPWITLALGTALTAFVSYERVRSGEHFPTDVIMGSLAGGAIGVLVPHFHRRPHLHEKVLECAPQWIGFAPPSNGAGSIRAGWIF